MKFRLLSLILTFLTVSVNAQGVSTHTISRTDGSNITYYLLHQLHTSPSDTLLLILQGSDCNSVLQIKSIFTDYKNAWPEADVLLIEKYGIDKGVSFSSDPERRDCPAQYIQNDSPTQRVADIQTVLDVVRKDGKYLNLIVLGGSEGAVIANLATTRIDDIDATISFNGGGRRFIDDVLHSIKSESENIDEIERNISGFLGFSNDIINSKPSDLEVSGHGYNWWYQMLSIDQLEILKKVNTPLLVIQGERDLSVSPQKVDEMMLALVKAGKDNIEYRTYKDLDHGFMNINGESNRKLVVNDIHVWLKSKLRNPNRSMQPTSDASAD
ncbi:alpha/beta hydrolase family protein [Desulfogranum japonicum]|uniref:alpha/beta hydrolase family protein n=1 Tax=Desulfogranum japonicum TaxID=231447 RepID=UPI00048A6E1F|nr:prolyl oligopeptidase family serine peptidase [Desulfogranum japonicum]